MSYCLKNIPGTYGVCVMQAGHAGPCSPVQKKMHGRCPACHNPLAEHKPDCLYKRVTTKRERT